MRCMYCGEEMVNGRITIYEMGTLIPMLHPATIRFTPDGDKSNVIRSNTYEKDSHGYYCRRCDRIIADFKPSF